MERCQHQARRGIDEARIDAAPRCASLRQAHGKPVRNLCLRAANGRQARRCVREEVSSQPESLEVFPGAAALVSKDCQLARDQRKEGRNAPKTSRPAYRQLGARATHTRISPHKRKKVTRLRNYQITQLLNRLNHSTFHPLISTTGLAAPSSCPL